jgi:hypothetical protein
MAKKSKGIEPLAMTELDSVMEGVVSQQAIENGSRRIESDFSNHTLVIPVPGLCIEWILGINGWPMSRTTLLAAEPHVGKTAMVAEITNWHRRLAGRGVIACTEGDKDSPVLRHSVLNYDIKAMEYRNMSTVEQWQDYLTLAAKRIMKLFASDPRYTTPINFGVDSMVGVLCKSKVDDIWETGHASSNFATEAKLVGDWIKTFSSKALAGNPFSFVGTSHIYLEAAKKTGMPPTIIVSGGRKMLYMSAMTFLMKHVQKLDQVGRKGQVVNFSMLKNTLAGTKQFHNFNCSLYWEHGEDGRQRTWWDWDEATIDFLADRNRFPAKGEVGKKVVEVCNIHEATGGRYWCKNLGVKEDDAMSGTELGKILHKNKEVIAGLREALNIYCHPPFQSFVKYEPAEARIEPRGEEEVDINEAVKAPVKE